MSAPRIDIDLGKIHHNAATLVRRLARRDIAVTGVSKAFLGSREIASAMLDAGVSDLGDARIENIESMRRAGVPARMSLIRSPMIGQAKRVVTHADVSFNTELAVISALSTAAREVGLTHGIVLMVELGDLREGIMPAQLESTVREVLHFPNIRLAGIGANLACCSGVVPDAGNMAELSSLADTIEADSGTALETVSGGNSSALGWALGAEDTGRINNLRLGEAILLGRNPLDRQAIDGLHTDAFTLVAEVIESKRKPTQPWGCIGQTAYGRKARAADNGLVTRILLAVGHQDTDPAGLEPPTGIALVGASSDHLIAQAGRRQIRVGSEIAFQPNYSALVRAMTSPFVAKHLIARQSRALQAC